MFLYVAFALYKVIPAKVSILYVFQYDINLCTTLNNLETSDHIRMVGDVRKLLLPLQETISKFFFRCQRADYLDRHFSSVLFGIGLLDFSKTAASNRFQQAIPSWL